MEGYPTGYRIPLLMEEYPTGYRMEAHSTAKKYNNNDDDDNEDGKITIMIMMIHLQL